MTGLSEAESPQLMEIPNTNQEHNGDLTTGPTTSTSASLQPSLEEKDHTPAVLLHRSIRRGSRRYSTQMPSGMVHPVAKGADEATARTRKRSVSTRGITGTPTSSVAAWATVTSGLRRSVSDMHAQYDFTHRRKASESPYEEMMERFQIRQLQRTPSTLEVGLEDLMGGDFDGLTTSARTARTPRGQHQDHLLLPRLSARNVSENASAPDAISRKASFLHLGDGSSIVAMHPPLESATSSLQLTEQYNLAYMAPLYQPSRKTIVVTLLACVERVLHRLMRPISPFSKISQARYAVNLVATIIYILWLPLDLAFHGKHHIASADTAIGVILGLDVMLTLHTGYMTETGRIALSHGQICVHYLKTRFVIDALILVPLLIHGSATNDTIPRGKWVPFLLDALSVERLAYSLRIVRVIWLIRANQPGSGHNFWAWLLYSRYSHLFRIAGIVAILVCIAHYIACIWTILLEEDELFESWRDEYSASFYAALLLLQGEGVPTSTAAQNLFASLSVIVGSIVLAVVFGHVAVLVSNFNANTTSYQRKMEEVLAMTAKLLLPAPLQARIHEYYEHLWHEYECLDGEIVQFSKELSHTLGLEVVLFKYMEVVMHVPFWKDCTPDFQKQLMLRLDVRVYLPNDFIMREGEVDDEFYMVNRGYCEIGRDMNRFERVTTTTISAGRCTGGFSIGRSNSGMGARRRNGPANGGQSDDGSRQSAYELDAAQRSYYRTGGRGGKGHDVLISRGQAFGDMALLMNYQRAANVRAVTHVEMCVLSREDFQVVLARYPEDRHRVVVDMLASYMQSYELCKSRCPLLELVRKIYSPEAIAEACAKSGGHPPLLPPVLSARQAAERIYTAMNMETNDGTLKFGVGMNIRDQLVNLRDRLRKKRDRKQQAKANPAASPTTSSHDNTDKSRGDCNGRMHNDLISDTREAVKPVQSAAGDSVAHESANSTLSPSLVERLKQAEEREIVIVQALQELKASFKLLQARQMTSVVPPSRKRPAPGDDTTDAKRTVGVPLVKRMGSFVGLASGINSENKQVGGQASKRSPTRYADELFSQGSSTAEQLSSHEPQLPVRRHPQPTTRQNASFSFLSEIESHRSTVEPPLLDQPSTIATTSTAAAGYNMPDQQRHSSKSLTSAPPEEDLQRMLFQRMPSQSMRKLQGASRIRIDHSSSTKAVAGEQAPRKRFQRTHSQSMRALTEALAAHTAPRGSLSNAQSRVLKRMSSFVSDTNGSVNSKMSPTRYADELFRL
ncbi:hypothetical protein PF010_g6488 [Phytophthora fragariae]|uniref:Cyclic nucleotide-binding domain-containing protein n=2 Tax=Phytophthora fragariae TaxID=53985 RepID=A0A6A3SVP2_9STRA|nr:hypothetical protein PF003_g12321 [Phytophthora fragariae]KAE8942157.1 hypothetical protein PF009_g8077 [Phytophthora fragariae]KAE9018882.1 hypothetical protein PF011_g6066 [Phytophthora fragariae]KAE9122110.1 hypothetical protein PF007_g7576 [Phytophthora fragariae]KAE9123195.1 hypothetical protein PF010_g6488 [Phytophthora fragariae]